MNSPQTWSLKKIRGKKVIDSQGMCLGKVDDLGFDKNGHICFLVTNAAPLEKILRHIEIVPIPFNFVSEIGKEIILKDAVEKMTSAIEKEADKFRVTLPIDFPFENTC